MKMKYFNYKTYRLDCSQYSGADEMDIHPSNDTHTCKMEHDDECESEIIQLLKKPFQYNLHARLIQV